MDRNLLIVRICIKHKIDNSTVSGNTATVNSVGKFSDSTGNILTGTIISQNNITISQRYKNDFDL